MATVEFVEVGCFDPDGSRPTVRALTLPVADGEFMVVLGPTGSGKTTILRMLAGQQRVENGVIRISGEDVAAKRPGERNVSMVTRTSLLRRASLASAEVPAEAAVRNVVSPRRWTSSIEINPS